VVTENEDGQELGSRSYFAIGAVLGLAASIGLALLVFISINTASSVKDAVSPPSLVPAAAAAGDTTSQADTATPADDSSTDDGTTDAGSGEDGASLVATGADLATSKGCVACHSTNGSDGVGPTWSGVFGSERALDDGSTVTADDDYLLESIVDPGAKLIDGFVPIMPVSFGDSLSQEELDALIAYIKSV
jgi:mono/diheme cytochrome c family protein